LIALAARGHANRILIIGPLYREATLALVALSRPAAAQEKNAGFVL
jgi:hypothetical protein